MITNKYQRRMMQPQWKTKLSRFIKGVRNRLDPNRLTRLERAAENKIHLVSPQEIRFISQECFSTAEKGKILAGNWDELSQPLEQNDLYQAFVNVCSYDRPWSETVFFRQALSQIKSGYPEWGCRTADEFQMLLQVWQDQYHEVSRQKLVNKNQALISVNIGRYGDMLLNDGQPWLIIAKLLELPEIPMIIHTRHREWVDFKQEIKAFAMQHRGIYAPLLHPDLAWFPAQHQGCERFKLIKDALIQQNGTVLDIGCHWGYFCHRFEDLGFACVGIEISAENFYFLKKLKQAQNKKFQIVNCSVFDYVSAKKSKHNIVLALNILHHFLKTKDLLNQLKDLFTQLETTEMYLETHRQSEPQMRNAYWNPSEDEFIQFILEYSVLKKATYLGHVNGGRSLYQLTS